MRRTFDTVLYALNEDQGIVMDEMGHVDEGLALRVYRQAMRRGEDEKSALQRLANGGVLAANGSTSENPGKKAQEGTSG